MQPLEFQANNAQLLGGAASGVLNAASGATGAVGSVASTTAGAVGSAASTTAGAVGSAATTVGGAATQLPGLGKLSAAAKGMLGSAVEGVSAEKLTESADKLDLKESYITIKGAQNAIEELSKKAIKRLDPVISGPAAASGCAKDKVEAAATLSKNLANLPVRAATLTKDGLVAYHTCSKETSYWGKKSCQALKLTPITVKAALLVYDTHKYSRQATTTVTTLNISFMECASKVVA